MQAILTAFEQPWGLPLCKERTDDFAGFFIGGACTRPGGAVGFGRVVGIGTVLFAVGLGGFGGTTAFGGAAAFDASTTFVASSGVTVAADTTLPLETGETDAFFNGAINTGNTGDNTGFAMGVAEGAQCENSVIPMKAIERTAAPTDTVTNFGRTLRLSRARKFATWDIIFPFSGEMDAESANTGI